MKNEICTYIVPSRASRFFAGAAFLGIAVAATPFAVLADSGNGWEHGPHSMWGSGTGGMMFGFVMMVAVIAAIAVLVVLVVRALGATGQGAASSSKTPVEILEERFARGEIDAEEFEARRQVLGSHPR